MDYWKLHVVGAGPIIRSLAVSRFCRILGTLLHNGVPILRSLQISKDATGNVILSEAVGLAAENISAGKSLAQPLKKSGQFSTEVVEMIAVGEEANSLETVLVDIADNMERRTNRQLELFVRLLEPVMLLAMAVVILFVVIALLLPVFKGAGGTVNYHFGKRQRIQDRAPCPLDNKHSIGQNRQSNVLITVQEKEQ